MMFSSSTIIPVISTACRVGKGASRNSDRTNARPWRRAHAVGRQRELIGTRGHGAHKRLRLGHALGLRAFAHPTTFIPASRRRDTDARSRAAIADPAKL